MKASKAIALLLVPLGLVFLGYHSCDREEPDFSSTQPTGGSSGYHHSSYWIGGRSWGSSGSSSSSGSHFSGTSRGGFGSHGGASMGS